MAKSLRDYLIEFDKKYKGLEYIHSTFHKNIPAATYGIVVGP